MGAIVSFPILEVVRVSNRIDLLRKNFTIGKTDVAS